MTDPHVCTWSHSLGGGCTVDGCPRLVIGDAVFESLSDYVVGLARRSPRALDARRSLLFLVREEALRLLGWRFAYAGKRPGWVPPGASVVVPFDVAVSVAGD